MTTADVQNPVLRSDVRAKPSGFFKDLFTVAARAIRAIPREPEAFICLLYTSDAADE